MAIEEVDVVVIGMGPGGEDLASRLARSGLSVVGVEARLLGGECPYYACIPTKMMVRAAETLAETRRVGVLAGTARDRPDWSLVADRISGEATTNWDDKIAVERFESTGGRFIRGIGTITAPGEVTVSAGDGEHVFRARRGIVLNPGTEPAIPPIEGLAGTPYWTNREAVTARRAPSSMLVLGAGPVGVEFAQVFARFGTDVTVVEAQPRLLPTGEPEASEIIASVLRSEGLHIHTSAIAQHVRHNGQFTVRLDSGDEIQTETLLVAVGRHSDLAALGVGAVGLDDSARSIPVDDRMRATENVWAIGDVTGHGAFTHISMYQSRIAAGDILGREAERGNYRAAPSVTFTQPEIATVGLTEEAAISQGISARTGIAQVPSTARGWIHKAGNEGLIKLVADADRDVLVGATVVAPYGGEIVGALAVAVHAEVPLARLRTMIYAYPTFHRGIEDALADLG